MAGEVIVDALPYIDQGYDEPGIREAHSLHQFESEIMKTEFERLQSRLPMEMMSMKRYELPQPPAGKTTGVASWSECLDNSSAQLEHRATRIANLKEGLQCCARSHAPPTAAATPRIETGPPRLRSLGRRLLVVGRRRFVLFTCQLPDSL
ncbi:hypothetical protein MRX96_008800 [Rhipicephalus microplus]